MSNELRAAVDACGNLAKAYRGVLALADAVGKIGDIESHRDELVRQREKAQKELDSVLASLATAKVVEELEAAVDAATATLATSRAEINSQAATLDAIKAKQAKAEARAAEVESEAGAAEKRLAEMRAEMAALQRRFAQ